MTKEDNLYWKSTLREIWRVGYNRTTAEDFVSYTPVSADKVKRCNDGFEGPEDDKYGLDLEAGYMLSLWNENIIDKLVAGIQEAHRENTDSWGVGEVSDQYLSAELFGLFKCLRDAWAQQRPRIIPGTMEAKTNGQAVARVAAARKKRLAAVKRTSAKQRKFEKRKKVVEMTLAIKNAARGAIDIETWEFFKKLLDHLGSSGMSEEEDEPRDIGNIVTTVYLVKICIWRAARVTDYFDTVDNTGLLLKTRGTAPKPRIRSEDKLGSSPALVEMPESIYDEHWLAEQRERKPYYVENVLKVSKEAFNFLTEAVEGMDEEEVA
ncbi:hypothetical protein B0H17DRAFT_1123974 [Mycena rosella]|uniref:Uncharacterized protein n=1 Tax=Mycena rosella TaxID=1033263 RepID=A0AAD7H3G3_MYCRO|nr:hypothetical protein B0H17DRAFT_1123974 [Mycena rosella]